MCFKEVVTIRSFSLLFSQTMFYEKALKNSENIDTLKQHLRVNVTCEFRFLLSVCVYR